MKMKQEIVKEMPNGVDTIFDPENNLDKVLQKQNPRLALDITPTTKHDPCHDLFRIYTFRLLKELSKKFEILLIYRDLQASVDIPMEKSKKLIEESISLMRGANVPFTVYYESEILQKHLVKLPEKFFRHLYGNILNQKHNHTNRHIMMSSASLAVLFPLLDVLNVDVLLCMEEEKDNVKILRDIFKKSDYFPVIFYRSLHDLENKKHSPADNIRSFPRVDWSEKKIYDSLISNKTNFETFADWYKKLNLEKEKSFDFNKEKISFNTLFDLVKSKKITEKRGLELVAKNLHQFMAQEAKFLDIASKELKLDIEEENSTKLLSCLNTPSRIKILKILNKGDFTAYEIAKKINISLPTTLFHLSKLQEAGIISRDNKKYNLKSNRFVLYV